MENRQIVKSMLLMAATLICVGCDQAVSDLSLPKAPIQDPGPVVARVGGIDLHQGEVPGLASRADDLREEIGLPRVSPATFQGRLELAVELLALSVEAPKLPVDSKDQTKRLLARVYLKRLIGDPRSWQFAPGELEEAHQNEIQHYQATRESDIYRPTMVDLLAITFGYFPDFHPPQKDEQVVMSKAQIENLLERIPKEIPRELDGFLKLARRLMSGHPTVATKEFPRVPLHAESPKTEAVIYQVLDSLGEYGALSPPVWTEGGAWIFRRGAIYPGKGEHLDEVRSEIESRVILQRKREIYLERMQALRDRYQIRTWPQRLFTQAPGPLRSVK
jgi:hypothetical protein